KGVGKAYGAGPAMIARSDLLVKDAGALAIDGGARSLIAAPAAVAVDTGARALIAGDARWGLGGALLAKSADLALAGPTMLKTDLIGAPLLARSGGIALAEPALLKTDLLGARMFKSDLLDAKLMKAW